MKAKYFIFIILITLCSCGGGDSSDENISVPVTVTSEPIDPPAAATLIFPNKDEVCEPGTSESDTKSKINFQWNSATNADTYDLKITNLDKNSVTEITNISGTSNEVSLDKGAPYSWEVKSKRSGTSETSLSSNWKFYLSGDGLTNHPPFPSKLISPRSGTTFSSSTTVIELSWEGSDPDNDSIFYTLFIDTVDGLQNPLSGNINLEANSKSIDVNSSTTYYWRIKASDSNGNSSYSLIYSFRVKESDSNFQYTFNEIDLNEPPFDGTIFISGDIITSSDPTLFDSLEYKGTGARQMYDRRNGGAWINIEPYLFETNFKDGLQTEIQINPEFTLDDAKLEANKYAVLIGQLPAALRKDVQTMWIHKGEEAYGGGNNNLLVHTGMSKVYENYWTGNIIEETLIHEATHTSIDTYHYPGRETDGAAWINAVSKDDGCYISTYAKDYPYREDLAELMPLYVAVRYFPERISSEIRDKILSCNFNRITYLDSLKLDMSLYEN